jgi:hypothetical protein
METLDAEYLKTLHTRVLLPIYQRARGYLWTRWHEGEPYDPEKPTYVNAQFFGYEPYGVISNITLEQMRAELATREHVPNKVEAKKIRQEKAKAKRNR